MSKSLHWFSSLFLVMLLSGCSSKQQTVLTPVPVEDRSVENMDFENPADASAGSDEERLSNRENRETSKQGSQSRLEKPVMTALLEDVDEKIKSNDDRAAAAALERALRLDAKNPVLWHRLAQLRLKQKNWQQALNLAKKSNSLAAGDYAMQLENWKLIYRANDAAGEHEAVEFARERIAELEAKRPR